MQKVRLDKFLWAVRIFKTRSLSATICKKGNVLVNDVPAKPSRDVKPGDIIKVKNKIVFRQYRVKQLLEKRVGAKLVDNYIEEITPEADLLKLKIYYDTLKSNKNTFKGRPTKKDRRQIERFLKGMDYNL